ncbi:class II aldolase/adducin family protein [bacterium]|nr:class II aldolase/adducin family protein [bacterium]
MSQRDSILRALLEAGQRLDQRQLVAGTEGNLSARLEDGTILITASGRFKGTLTPNDLVLVDLEGKKLEGAAAMSSEGWTHLEAYRARPDIGAVVHAHPPHVLALNLQGWDMEAVPLAEAAYGFGSVPTCEFAVPGTPEGAASIGGWIEKRDALLLDRHGAVTVGSDLRQALARMEMLEAVARVIVLARGPNHIRSLEAEQVERIRTAALLAGGRKEAIDAWAEKVG